MNRLQFYKASAKQVFTLLSILMLLDTEKCFYQLGFQLTTADRDINIQRWTALLSSSSVLCSV